MTNFANAAAFDDPRSALQAMGTNLSENSAIVDAHGRVLAYARTGGIIEKTRLELNPNETIYRFGSSAKSTTEVARGGWWIQEARVRKIAPICELPWIVRGSSDAAAVSCTAGVVRCRASRPSPRRSKPARLARAGEFGDHPDREWKRSLPNAASERHFGTPYSPDIYTRVGRCEVLRAAYLGGERVPPRSKSERTGVPLPVT